MIDHHAFLLRVDDFDEIDISSQVELLGFNELLPLNFTNFGIGDSRVLIEQAYVRPLKADVRLIVVQLNQITTEAQQALLKIVEEPPSGTAFLFVVPQGLFLLDTLLSRFQVLSPFEGNRKASTKILTDFLYLSVAERIEVIGKKTLSKDELWINQIKKGLFCYLESGLKGSSLHKASHLHHLASLLQTRGSSNKYLLEELALTLDYTA